jgi:RHS repeat-associated protein
MTSTLNAVGGGSFSYDTNDRLTTDTIDSNGNTTLSGGVSNTYDFENRMTAHGSTTMMVYDGDGNRVSETVGGATTKYLVDTLNPTGLPQVLDETVNSSVTRTYAYGLQRISENQLNGSTWTPSFYGYDGHGNVRFLTNSAGTVTDTYQYDGFGRLIATTGSTPNNFKYSGEQFDANLGLYNLRARYYNQATGRFWARDPVEGKLCCGLSWNPYIFVKDNPLNATDPTGRDVIIEKEVDTFETITIETLDTLRLRAMFRYELCVDGGLVTAAAFEAAGHIPSAFADAVLTLIEAYCSQLLLGGALN